MTRVWQLTGLAGVAVLGLLIGVLVPDFPDSIILVLYLVAFFALLLAYSKWKDYNRERNQSQLNSSEAEFNRSYARYQESRRAAYRKYLQEQGWPGQTFEESYGIFIYPSYAEWKDDHGATY